MAEARASPTALSFAPLTPLVQNAPRLGGMVTAAPVAILDHQVPAIVATRATIGHDVAHLPTVLRSMTEQMRVLAAIHTGNFFR